MILGFIQKFNNQYTLFKENIISGIKKHSFREDITDRWKPGRIIHMATGVRTKYYNCFDKKICISTQKIQILHSSRGKTIYIDNSLYAFLPSTGECPEKDKNRLRILAYNDGFNSISDFFQWFNKDFKGKIIHWTDLKY